MTEQQATEIEHRVMVAEDRITQHGREIDGHEERIIRLEMSDKFRADQMARIEEKLDSTSGKLDSITTQITQLASKPAQVKADMWDKVTWVIVSGVVGAALALVLATIGLSQ